MADPIRSSPQVVQMMRAGFAHHQQGRLAEAEAMYARALTVEPDNPDALHLLGLILNARGDFARAVELIGRAVQRKPHEATFHVNLGVVLQAVGDFGRAENHFRRAIELDPKLAEAHAHRSTALRELKQLEAAEASARRAIALHPNLAAGHLNLANVLHAILRHAEADAEYGRALELGSPRFGVLTSWGDSLRVQSRWNEAQPMLEEAIRLNPSASAAHWNLALLLLQRGKWSRGFDEFEWRARQSNVESLRKLRPSLESVSLEGRSVLLYAEQGLGDTIQFCRYAAMLGEMNRRDPKPSRIVIGVQAEVKRLMETVANVDAVIGDGEAIPDVDVIASLMSLPRLFGTTVENTPRDVPYLSATVESIAVWEARLRARQSEPDSRPRRIGIVWAGSATHTNDHNRSIDPTLLSPLASAVDRDATQWVSLQIGSAGLANKRLPGSFAAIDFAQDIHDFADSAALVSCLDLVIAVDTSTAHLAGALGKPVWLMLPQFADWRWLMDRDDSVWYPTMRLFRQEVAGDWERVISRIATALRD